ncbi:MAG: DoxX family protein [Allosphingosinicella sp.]
MFNTFARYQPQLLGLLRIVAGLLFLAHGVAKLFGFPPTQMPSPEVMSLFWIGGVIELVAGTLIMIGLFTRPAAFIASGQMAVAYWMFHAPQNLYPVANQGDAAILYCFIFLFIAAAGPGAWSLDGSRAGRAGRSR